jgi:hypothetical protein
MAGLGNEGVDSKPYALSVSSKGYALPAHFRRLQIGARLVRSWWRGQRSPLEFGHVDHELLRHAVYKGLNQGIGAGIQSRITGLCDRVTAVLCLPVWGGFRIRTIKHAKR